MQMKIKALISSLCVLISLVANAQEKWDLKKCIETAWENNIQIKMQENNEWLAQKILQQSYATHFPTLNGIATHVYNFGQTIDPYTNQFANSRVRSNNFALQSQWTLFAGRQNYFTTRQNIWNYKSSQSTTQATKNNIALQVANLFLNALIAKENVEIAKNQVNITRLQLEKTQRMYETGLVRPTDLYSIRTQLATEKTNLVNLENQYKMALLNLAQAMRIPSSTPFEPYIALPGEDWEIAEVYPSPEIIFEEASKNLPQIQSAEQALKSAEFAFKASKAAFYPRLTFSASLGTGYSGLQKEILGVNYTGVDTIGFTNSGDYVLTPSYDFITQTIPFQKQLDKNFNQSIGFTLSIPLMNAWNVRTNKHRNEVNLKNSQWQLEQTKQQLYMDIENAYRSYIFALENFKARKENIRAFEENYRLAEAQFDQGLIDAYLYNNTKNQWMKAQSDLIQAKYELLFRMKILDFYMGKNLE